MSWSTSVGPVPAKEFMAAIDAAKLPEYSGLVYTSEVLEQFDAAKTAAQLLFRSGTVGDPNGEGKYAANLGGHANPGHKDTPGWSNDSVSVNVYRSSL